MVFLPKFLMLSLLVIILIIPLQASAQTLDEQEWKTSDVYVHGGSFSEVDVTLRYKIDNAELGQNKMMLSPYFYSLDLDLDNSTFGTIVLELPRHIFDSKMPDGVTDKPFTAESFSGLKRSELEVRELETTEDKRVIEIELDPSSNLSIDGTHVLTYLGTHAPSTYDSTWQTVQVDVLTHPDVNATIRYTILFGELDEDSVSIDPRSNQLFLNVNATQNGTVDLELPRHVFNSKMPDGISERPFTAHLNVNASMTPAEVREVNINDADVRMIEVKFPAMEPNSEYNMVISGTHAIPEFGAIAPILLGVSMASVLVMATRFRRFG